MVPKVGDTSLKKNLMRTNTIAFESVGEGVVALCKTEIVPVGLVTKRSGGGLRQKVQRGLAPRLDEREGEREGRNTFF